MLVQHIALVPVTDGVDPSELARVGAALQTQVLRDVSALWGVDACVAAFPRLEDMPLGYLPILVTPRELAWGAGVHLDDNGQPYAQVELGPFWSHAASRACLELLVNPLAERCVSATSPRADQGLVQILVEICAACAAPEHGYGIDGVLVSDFCTPAYFVPEAAAHGARAHSFHGSLLAPLSLREGGHISWFDLDTNAWWVRVGVGTGHEDRRLGALDRPFVSVRELIGRQRPSGSELELASARLAGVLRTRDDAQRAADARARRLRALVGISDQPRLEHQPSTPLDAPLQTDLDNPPGKVELARIALVKRERAVEPSWEGETADAAPHALAAADDVLASDELTDPGYELVADHELSGPELRPLPEPVTPEPIVPQLLMWETEPQAMPAEPLHLESIQVEPIQVEPIHTSSTVEPILPPPPAAASETEDRGAGESLGAALAATPKLVAPRWPQRRKPARTQWRPPRPSAPANTDASAGSSIAPMLALEPAAKPSALRDARLLGIAAALGVGFFALVARERGDAHAATGRPAAAPTDHARQASPPLPASAGVDAGVQAAPAPVVGAPESAAAVSPAAPVRAATSEELPDAGARAEGTSRRPDQAARRTRVRTNVAAEPAQASIEELLDTRR